jgi:hypothetical protein
LTTTPLTVAVGRPNPGVGVKKPGGTAVGKLRVGVGTLACRCWLSSLLKHASDAIAIIITTKHARRIPPSFHRPSYPSLFII